MKKEILVAYFSATGTTARAARKLAAAIGADVHEIRPERPYSSADLDWTDPKSRSSIEMNSPAARPAISGKIENLEKYGLIFVGFPIWWYVAPVIVNSFLESCDLSGKTVVPFATSGGSGMGKSAAKLAPSCKGATLLPGKMLNGNLSETELKAWVESLAL